MRINDAAMLTPHPWFVNYIIAFLFESAVIH
jgi:hypothetical protein